MEQKFDFSQADPLFVEVARFVVENNRMAWGSPLERKFEIGFNRSRRILEQLKQAKPFLRAHDLRYDVDKHSCEYSIII